MTATDLPGRRLAIAAFLLSSLIAPTCGQAASTQCPSHFDLGQAPDLPDSPLTSAGMALCSIGYAVWYSAATRTPLYSAEFLTPDRVAHPVARRTNDFRADTRLPARWQAHLRDYQGSGYDRGHMSPSGDMTSRAADSQSFLLSNMVPQNAQLNRNLWEAIESGVRRYARKFPLYVITGPIFEGNEGTRINGRVMVPTAIFKVLYDPTHNAAGGYLVENAANQSYQDVSLAKLQALTGIDFFPATQQVDRMRLPSLLWHAGSSLAAPVQTSHARPHGPGYAHSLSVARRARNWLDSEFRQHLTPSTAERQP